MECKPQNKATHYFSYEKVREIKVFMTGFNTSFISEGWLQKEVKIIILRISKLSVNTLIIILGIFTDTTRISIYKKVKLSLCLIIKHYAM